jgi:hypothetical protein
MTNHRVSHPCIGYIRDYHCILKGKTIGNRQAVKVIFTVFALAQFLTQETTYLVTG